MTSSSNGKSSWWICNLWKHIFCLCKMSQHRIDQQARGVKCRTAKFREGCLGTFRGEKSLEPVEAQSLGPSGGSCSSAASLLHTLQLQLRRSGCTQPVRSKKLLLLHFPNQLLVLCRSSRRCSFAANGDLDPHFAAAHQKTTFLARHPDWPPGQVLQLH